MDVSIAAQHGMTMPFCEDLREWEIDTVHVVSEYYYYYYYGFDYSLSL
jgi:hypothetical protein